MSTAFDAMYLPGGDFSASPYDLGDFDGFQAPFPQGNHATVSPTELFVDDSMVMSAPASSAFPNLSTPSSSFLESPAMASSGFNTSPLVDGLLDSELNYAELDKMEPLFPQNSLDQFTHQQLPQELPTDSSLAPAVPQPPQTRIVRQKSTGMERQKSSPGRPPSQPYHMRKPSETCGISKTSKARKVLEPLEVDSNDDKETAKRKKNTLAARKSRARKMEHAEGAMAEIQRLRAMLYHFGHDPDAEI